LPRVLALAATVSALVAFGLSLYRPPFSFEVTIASSISGTSQVYYDIGQGISEHDSSIASIRQGEGRYRFPLPHGTYRALRFDPSDKGGNEMAVGGLRIIDRSGRSLRALPNQLAAIQEIDRIECAPDLCRLKTSRGSDSILSVQLGAPLVLVENAATFWGQAAQDFFVCLVGIVAVTLLFALLMRKVGPMAAQWSGTAWNWATRRPRQAVLLLAICGTLLSSYPVVFFGKSFVSPNVLGSGMLYGAPPFLPGYQDTDLENPKGADKGAMLWQNLAYSFVQSRALKQDHELPLWNRYNSAGAPLLAQGLSMFGDPLHIIVLIANGAAWAWDLKFILAKTLFCFAIGLLVFRASGYLPSALLLAVSSAFIGFFSFRFNHPAFFSMCYAPWILLCWFEMSRAHSPRAFAGWASGLIISSLAELNSGGVKEGYMLLLSMHGTGLLVFVMTVQGRQRVKKLCFLAVLGIAFILLSAPIWLPFLDTLKSSWTAYDITPTWQIQLSLALGFFDEIFYRVGSMQNNVFNPSANFLVLLGSLFAVAYFRLLLRERIFIAVALGSLPVFALVFGILPAAVISKIPVLGNVGHVDNTFSCALIIHAIVIAGFGLECLIERIRRPDWNSRVLVVSLGFLALCGLYLGFTQATQREPLEFIPLGTRATPNLFFYVYSVSIMAALLALPFLARVLFRRPSKARIIVPSLIICFLIIHWRFGMHLQTDVAQIDDVIVNPQVRVDLQAHSPTVAWLKANPVGFRTVGFGDTFFPGYNGISGLESLTGTDPLQNTYYRDLLVTAEIPLLWMWRWVVEKETFDSARPLYNLLNVRYFLDSKDDAEIRRPGLLQVAELDLKVFENAAAWPRAFWVPAAEIYDSTEQFVAMVRNNPGPFAAIQRSDTAASGAIISTGESPPPKQPIVPARDYKFTNNTTTFTVDASGPGIAVLTETYWPGDFFVQINGSAASYFRVNHAFRGVKIPTAGAYTVSFSYWPHRFSAALWLAAVGALILTLCIVALFRIELLDRDRPPPK
jgi:hypothetical protein